MASVQVTCVNKALKQLLDRELEHIEDAEQRKELQGILEELPDCEGGLLVGLEVPDAVKAGKGGKKKRPPSAYNLFMGDCIKQRPEGQAVQEAMQGCSIAWNEKKQAEEGTKK